jgi:hypothetical protein
MAFWLGCAGSGGEKNYKELEGGPQQPVMQPERPIGGPNPAEPRSDAAPGDQPYRETTAEAVSVTAGGEAPVVRVAAEPVTQPATTPMTLPTIASSNALDRSAWPRLTVTPVDPELKAHPVYFSNATTAANARTLDTTADTDAQLTAALGGSSSVGLNQANLDDFYMLPLEFGRDMILLPFRAGTTYPWQFQPSRGASPAIGVSGGDVNTASPGAAGAAGEGGGAGTP